MNMENCSPTGATAFPEVLGTDALGRTAMEPLAKAGGERIPPFYFISSHSGCWCLLEEQPCYS